MKELAEAFNAKEQYSKWHRVALEKIIALKKKGKLLAWFRLFFFLLLATSVILIFSEGIFFILPTLVVFSVFIYLVATDQKNQTKITYWETYSKVIESELKAIDYDFIFDSGSQYIDNSHPYTNDLDIFGERSVFQSLNRTATTKGSNYLANLFINLTPNNDSIRKTQEAVKELSNNPEWLLRYRTYGLMGKTLADSENELREWVNSKAIFNGSIFSPLLIIIPAISIIMIFLLITGSISFSAFILYLLLPLGLPAIYAGKVSKKHAQLSRKSEMLENYSNRLVMIERETFHSVLLNKIRKNVISNNSSAGKAIRSLSRIISSMDARLNWLMWIILNFLFIWDIRQTMRLEKWQKRHKKDIEVWFDSLASIESLGSLAGFYILNQDFTFPEITEQKLTVEATKAGHPLIPSWRRITNEIKISGNSSFTIITGANMAGKSTYLRTVAVNLILGSMGAPVCANYFSFFPASLYTSLHTLDSLTTNKSYFFAELERLKMIIDTLNNGKLIYIFLDEILKGTNTYDKQQGSIALMRQMIKLQAAGMIATHDLELGKLESVFPENISNKCFEAEIKEGELLFDYKLRPGIAKNMNATFLMKRMGITLDDY